MYSSYLYNDVIKSETKYRKSVLIFLEQTCRAHGFTLNFSDMPLMMDSMTVVGITWSLESKDIFATFSGDSISSISLSGFSTAQLCSLFEHIVMLFSDETYFS